MNKTGNLIMAAIAAAAIFAAFASPARAADLLEPKSIAFETGKIKQNDGQVDLYIASLITHYHVGGLTAAVDFNFYADKELHTRDGGNDLVVVDMIRFVDGDRFKIQYGDIENLTFGSGFIVSNYRSNLRGNTPLNRSKGIELDLASRNSYIKMFGTRSDLFGMRAVRNFGPVTLGATAVGDADPDFKEIAIDAEMNMAKDSIKLYAESAKILDYGNGTAAGVVAAPMDGIVAKVELRDFSYDFVPGIVDEHYDAVSPFSRLKGDTSRTMGYYSCLDFFPGGENSAKFAFERYEGRKPRATVNARGRFRKFRGELFAAQENFIPKTEYTGPRTTVTRGLLGYRVSKRAELIFDFYKAYDDGSNGLKSLTVKTNIKLR